MNRYFFLSTLGMLGALSSFSTLQAADLFKSSDPASSPMISNPESMNPNQTPNQESEAQGRWNEEERL